ncbi:MAG: hypothetical protein SGPRY_011006 [Prymnesium sp.]
MKRTLNACRMGLGARPPKQSSSNQLTEDEKKLRGRILHGTSSVSSHKEARVAVQPPSASDSEEEESRTAVFRGKSRRGSEPTLYTESIKNAKPSKTINKKKKHPKR